MADSGPELRSKGAPSSQGRPYDYNRLRAIRSGLEQAGWGKPYGATAAEVGAEREIMAGLPGMEPTDYAKYLAQTQEMGKLQLALAMAQAGFTAAGTPPREGEWAATTLGRGLAPLAPLVGEAATNLQKQKMALELAKKQEARDLSLAAYKTATTGRSGVQDAALDIFKAEIKAQKGDGFWKDINLVAKDVDGDIVLVKNKDGSRIQVVQDKQNPSILHNIRGGSHTLEETEFLITPAQFAARTKARVSTLDDTPRLVVRDIDRVPTKVTDDQGRPIQVRFDNKDAKNLWRVGSTDQHTLAAEEYLLTQSQWNTIKNASSKGIKTWYNTSKNAITKGGITIPSFKFDNLSEQFVSSLGDKDRQSLIEIGAPDLAQDPYMVKFGKELTYDGKKYGGGESLYLSKIDHAQALTPEDKANLVPEGEKADALRGNRLNEKFRAYQRNVLKVTDEEAIKNLSEANKEGLLASFGKTVRANQIDALHKEFHRILGPYTTPIPAVGQALKGVPAYIQKGELQYNQLGMPRTFSQLPYEDQAAFSLHVNWANPNLRNPEKRHEIFQAARDQMDKDKKRYKEFGVDDRQDFTGLLKVYGILDRLSRQDIDYLGETGVIKGLFTKLGSKLADWDLVGSEKSGQLAVLLKQLGANLKALQASASDTRPSNWRLELISETAPNFTTAETVNSKNVELAKRTVAAALTSFGTMGDTFVIPKEMAAMAEEWGIPFNKIDQNKYYWKDPTVQEVVPYTRDQFQKAMGDIKFTFEDFLGTKVGGVVNTLSKDGKRYARAKNHPTKTILYKGNKIPLPQVILLDKNGRPIPGTVEEIGISGIP